MEVELEKRELLSLFLHLTDRYDELDPVLQGLARRVEDQVYGAFTVSEIAEIDRKNEGAL